jgi:hypothetical protein
LVASVQKPRNLEPVGMDAVDEVDGSAAFAAVDGEGDFRVGGSGFDRISECGRAIPMSPQREQGKGIIPLLAPRAHRNRL